MDSQAVTDKWFPLTYTLPVVAAGTVPGTITGNCRQVTVVWKPGLRFLKNAVLACLLVHLIMMTLYDYLTLGGCSKSFGS